MLSNADIDALDELLFSPPWQDTALDYYGYHGAVTANVIAPVALETSELFLLVTGLDNLPDTGVPELFADLTQRLQAALRSTLELDGTLVLPTSSADDPEQALGNWCAGFVDVYLQNDAAWLTRDAQHIIDWLMPILTLSDAFDDADFRKARANPRICQQMRTAIPDAIKDLYLHFHA